MGWVQAVVLLFIAALFFVVVCLAPKKAGAAELSMCAPAASLQTKLLKDFGEAALLEWVEKDGTHRAIFANQDTGAWTFVAIDERGYACTMRSGTGFSILASDRAA
ncbi:MAG TPA: hypothetical protein DEP24_00815 [Mycobacterium sp.]|nr:hypothetical protein [Mycobacterium sp.]